MITSASVSEVGLDDVLVGVMFASWALPIWSASSCRKCGVALFVVAFKVEIEEIL